MALIKMSIGVRTTMTIGEKSRHFNIAFSGITSLANCDESYNSLLAASPCVLLSALAARADIHLLLSSDQQHVISDHYIRRLSPFLITGKSLVQSWDRGASAMLSLHPFPSRAPWLEKDGLSLLHRRPSISFAVGSCASLSLYLPYSDWMLRIGDPYRQLSIYLCRAGPYPPRSWLAGLRSWVNGDGLMPPLRLVPTYPRSKLGLTALWRTLGEFSSCKYIFLTSL